MIAITDTHLEKNGVVVFLCVCVCVGHNNSSRCKDQALTSFYSKAEHAW